MNLKINAKKINIDTMKFETIIARREHNDKLTLALANKVATQLRWDKFKIDEVTWDEEWDSPIIYLAWGWKLIVCSDPRKDWERLENGNIQLILFIEDEEVARLEPKDWQDLSKQVGNAVLNARYEEES